VKGEKGVRATTPHIGKISVFRTGWIALVSLAGTLAIVFASILAYPPVVAASSPSFAWTGEATMGIADWSTGTNWATGVSPAPSSSIATFAFPSLLGPGCATSSTSDACYTSVNDLDALTVNQLAIEDNDGYDLSGQGIALGSGGISASPAPGASGALASVGLPIALNASQTWTVAGPSGGAVGQSGLLFSSPLTGAGDALTIDTSNGSGLLLTSETEVGPIAVEGTDTSDTGLAARANGGLFLASSGSLNSSDGGSVTLHDAGLEAAGSTGALASVGGELVVGEPTGVLRAPSATFDPASAVAFSIVGAGTVAGVDYSQLASTGAISLGGASLSIDGPASGEACAPTLPVGQQYTLIRTSGSLSGSFGNAPEGSEVAVTQPGPCAPQHLRIAYQQTGAMQTVTGTVVGATPNSGSIAGKVTSAATDTVVAGIQVCGYGNAGERCAETNSSGEYTLSNLPAGEYSVEFSAPSASGLDYLTQYYNGAASYSSAAKVSVSAGQDTAGIDAALSAGGQIEGRVIAAATDTALAGIQVCAYESAGEYSGGCATTSASGEYTVPALPTGQYTVEFSVPAGSSLDYLPQYYDDEPSATAAKTISITAGATSSGIDASMQAGAQIAGKVTSASTNATLAGIEVCASRPNGSYVGRCVTTNASGEYVLPALTGGQYTLRYSVAAESNLDYLPQYYNGRSSLQQASIVSVAAGETASGIDAELQRGGLIAGKVTSAATKAIVAGVQVCPYASSGGYVGGCTTTNARGEYTLSGLASGLYTVYFSSPYGGSLDYLPQFYGDEPSVSEGHKLSVTAGATTSGIDAELEDGSMITGTVTSAATHVAIADVEVCLYTASGDSFVQCTFSGPGGEYSMLRVVAGEYKVEFGLDGSFGYTPQYFGGGSSFSGADTVSVAKGASVSGIDAELQEGGHITGRVIIAPSKAPVADVEVCAYAPSATYSDECAFTDSSGEYALVGLSPGEYKIEFSPFNDNLLAQYFSAAPSLSQAKAVSVTAGETTPGIDAELQEGGRISGEVTAASSKAPIADVEVCVYPSTSEVPYGCAFTGASGEYTFSGLTTGEYKLSFVPIDDDLAQYFNGKSSLAEGGTVSVVAGETTAGIDAELQSGGVISGTVTDASTKAGIEEIEVCLYTASDVYLYQCTSTGPAGEYSLSGLLGGEYKVEFYGVGALDYATQFYGGTASFAEAKSISLASGGTASGIDAELHGGGLIVGHVTGAATAFGIEGVEACALPRSGGSYGECVYTEFGGEYTLTGLPGGEYDVEFVVPTGSALNYLSQYYTGESAGPTPAPVSVVVGAITSGIDGALQPSVTTVPANTSPPTLSGTAAVGESLADQPGSWSAQPTSFSYQWLRCDSEGTDCAGIPGATGQSYTVSSADVGSTIRVQETAKNLEGASVPASSSTSAVVPVQAVPASVVAPTIGSSDGGNVLSAEAGSWTNAPTSFAYQWERCNGSGVSCTVILGATGGDYSPSEADVGNTLEVQVTASNTGGAGAPASSAPSAVIQPPPLNTAVPTIAGTAEQGQTLTESHGSWSVSPNSYSYRWERCDSAGNACATIEGATGQTYLLGNLDVGSTIRVQETAVGSVRSSAPALSALTAVVQSPPGVPTNTSLPTVSGIPQQDQTLTEGHGVWSGSPTSYAYQWLRCSAAGTGCAAIPGAVGQSYTPTVADGGFTIRAQETAVNGSGASVPASSAATGVVVAVPGETSPPTISGIVQQSQTLTEGHGAWTGSPTSYVYQWLRCDATGSSCVAISGAIGQDYQLAADDVGSTIEVQETATNTVGTSSPSTSNATFLVMPPVPVNTAAPTISGVAQQGQTVTAVQGAWTNSPTGHSYQWLRCSSTGTACSPIAGATDQTYEPLAGDVGHELEVQETAGNEGGLSAPADSPATTAVLPEVPHDISPPTISGVPEQGQTLTEAHGSWTNGPTEYTYQWLQCNGPGTGCLSIAGATNPSYSPTAADVGHTLELEETAVNAGGRGSSATSVPTAIVIAAPPSAVAPPSISGIAQQGQTLTEGHGAWTNEPVSYSYQWLRCEEAGEQCSPIAGAIGETYTPTAADVGHTLKVEEVAINAGGPSSPEPSAATAVVVPPIPTSTVAPKISGAARQDETLTEEHGSWTNSPIRYEYQWELCDGSGANCEPIAGASSQSFELVAVDVGHTLRVQEIAVNAGGSSTPAVSEATTEVLAAPPVDVLPPSISGTAQQGQTLTEADGSWTNEPTSFEYQWLRCSDTGAGCVAIPDAIAQSYVPVAADVGHELEVQELATNAGGTSSPAASEATAVVVPPVPVNTQVPTIGGSARQGSTLTEEHGSWTNSPTRYEYQWLQCNSLGAACLPISGATEQTYVPAAADIGHTLVAQETAINAGGSSEPARSIASALILASPPTSKSPPTVSGDTELHQTLVVQPGEWTNEPTSYEEQWLRCEGTGSNCQPIPGAVDPAYVTTTADVGHTIAVREIAVNAGGQSSPASSAATSPIVAPPLHASAGEDVDATVGIPVTLDASGSTPAPEITGYGWDFGDGSSASGAVVTHTYGAPGIYTATIAVQRGAESAEQNVTVSVAAPPSHDVTVNTHDAGGSPLPGVEVLYIGPTGTRIEGISNGSGVATLDGVPDGEQTFYAWASGYQPVVGHATVSAGGGETTVTLASGAIATSTLKSHEMDLQEIEAAGIDTSDPANQRVFEFEIRLAFIDSPAEQPPPLLCYINSEGHFVGTCATGSGGHCTADSCIWGWNSGGGVSPCCGVAGGGCCGGIVAVPKIVEGHPLIQWLILRGKATILKQFFAVTMITQNLSPEPFKLTHGSATLNLPPGLSLAPTATPQAPTQAVPDIPGLGSATTEWVVRGDETGAYYLSASYKGTLEPFAAPVEIEAALTSPLKVWGANALSLSVKADNSALAEGVPYHVTVAITNKAEVPLYNVDLAIDEDVHSNFIFQPDQSFHNDISELKPGQTLTDHEYILVPDAASVSTFNPSLSSATFDGEEVHPGEGIEAVPPPPLYSLSGPVDTPNMVHLHWQPVPGAEGYEVFSTSDLDTPFPESPGPVLSSPSADEETTTLPAGSTDAYIFGSSTEKPKYYAVSALIKGTPTLEFPVIPVTAGAEPPQAGGGAGTANGGVLGSDEVSGGADDGAGAPTPTCARHSIALAGGVTVEASCFYGPNGGPLTASGRIRVNGLDIETTGEVTLDPRTLELRSAGQVDVKAGSILIYKGDLAWNFHAQLSLGVPAGLTVKGLPIDGDIAVSLIPGGARAVANATIGGSFAVSGQIDLELTLAEGLKLNGLSLELASDIPIKSLVVKKAKLSYRRTSAGDVWEGDVAVDLPGDGPTVEGALTLTNGSVSEVSVDVSGINKPLGDVVFLQSLGLEVRFAPRLAAKGSIGLSAGPSIDGYTAVSLDGSLTAEIGDPFVLEAAGTLSMVDEKLASASAKATIPGGVAFSGEISQTFLVIDINGGISGSVTPHSFEAQGHVTINEHVISASGEALVNNTGLAGCASATVGVGFVHKTVTIGGSHRWSGANSLFTDSCGFGRLKSALGAAAAAVPAPPAVVHVASNTKQLNLIVKGADGPPDVALAEGQSSALVTPNTTGAFAGTVYLAVADPTDDETDIAIADPPAGTLTVGAPSGQPNLVSVGSTVPLPTPDVRVKVHALGARRFRLSWSARVIAGQTLVFEDVDARGRVQVLSTTHSRGHVDFTALDNGASGPQRLRVVVEQDGLTREILTGAVFRPGPVRLGKPRVGVRLSSKAALINWSTVPSAAGYEVSISTSDGRRLFFSVGPSQQSVRVPGATRVSARVRGFGGGMEVGPLGSGSASRSRS
jgi:hypothetical protein